MVRQCLNGKWELDYKQQGQGSLVNISPKLLAEVPGEVHLDLEREGVIKDPLRKWILLLPVHGEKGESLLFKH
jgi:hypothetical protein